jgi:recombination protein RecT
MYRGLLKLARRSDEIASVDAQVVYDGDVIELETGTDPFVRHVPELDGSKRGGFVGAYAYARLANGEKHVDYMTTAEIEISRSKSRAKESLGWVSFWGEMARKTVLRRLMKRLPLESLAELALRRESEAEDRALEPIVVSSAPVVSDARARIVGRFADPTKVAGALASGSTGSAAGETSASSETATDTRETVAAESGPDPTKVSNDDLLEEASLGSDEAETREICGATSDLELGPVETCTLEPDHDLAAGGSKVHKSDAATWPVEKRKEGTK